MPPTSTKYSVLWESEQEFKGWLRKSDKKDWATRAKCIWCNADFSVANGGKHDVIKHLKSNTHKQIANARIGQKSIAEYSGENFC